MTKNYNANLGVPYVKISFLNLDYSMANDIERQFVFNAMEGMGIKDTEQNYYDIGGIYSNNLSQIVLKNEANNIFPLIDVDTGEETGKTMTTREMNQVLMSFIRKYQKERDNPVI
jgi:hypothetical protein